MKDGQLYEFTVYSNLDFTSDGYDELNSSNKDAASGVQYYAPPAKIKKIVVATSSYWYFYINDGGNSMDEWVNSIDGVKAYCGAQEYNVTLETDNTSSLGRRFFRILKSTWSEGSTITIIPYHNRNTNHSEWNGFNNSYTSLTLGQPFQIGSLECENYVDPYAP